MKSLIVIAVFGVSIVALSASGETRGGSNASVDVPVLNSPVCDDLFRGADQGALKPSDYTNFIAVEEKGLLTHRFLKASSPDGQWALVPKSDNRGKAMALVHVTDGESQRFSVMRESSLHMASGLGNFSFTEDSNYLVFEDQIQKANGDWQKRIIVFSLKYEKIVQILDVPREISLISASNWDKLVVRKINDRKDDEIRILRLTPRPSLRNLIRPSTLLMKIKSNVSSPSVRLLPQYGLAVMYHFSSVGEAEDNWIKFVRFNEGVFFDSVEAPEAVGLSQQMDYWHIDDENHILTIGNSQVQYSEPVVKTVSLANRLANFSLKEDVMILSEGNLLEPRYFSINLQSLEVQGIEPLRALSHQLPVVTALDEEGRLYLVVEFSSTNGREVNRIPLPEELMDEVGSFSKLRVNLLGRVALVSAGISPPGSRDGAGLIWSVVGAYDLGTGNPVDLETSRFLPGRNSSPEYFGPQ